MTKNVTLYLGPGGTHLASRSLIITRMMRAGDDSAPSAEYTDAAIGNTTETVEAVLPANTLFQAVLQDTTAGDALVSDPDVLNFHTGDNLFPGPKGGGRLSILSIEDVSTSSSSGSSSSWSSQSSQSTSSSSQSLSSSSSVSSQSTSSSSASESTSSSSSSQSSSSQSDSSSSSVSSQSSQSLSSQSSSSSSGSESSSSWSSQS